MVAHHAGLYHHTMPLQTEHSLDHHARFVMIVSLDCFCGQSLCERCRADSCAQNAVCNNARLSEVPVEDMPSQTVFRSIKG